MQPTLQPFCLAHGIAAEPYPFCKNSSERLDPQHQNNLQPVLQIAYGCRFDAHALEGADLFAEPARGGARWMRKQEGIMAKFSKGDHVRWNSEAGQVSGRITKVHERDFDYKGHKRRASKDAPQYEIESDKTDHVAAHKEDALTRID
ncbi:DUF2945 domain-containing protein [Limimaricola soesokkakensis]|uniref:DUF2945 domain-containing protein n=1 Tax=Limimaricola soesokkakensis TaxID=1343159 RepID=UPI00351701ED